MAKSYQLVAWTDKGQVRMIPSEIHAFLHGELDKINRLIDRIRYKTWHEIHDTLEVSSAYEKLGLELLDLGQIGDAFQQFAAAAHCCTASDNNWEDTEYGEILCKPLRGRFFAMFCQCKDLVHRYPKLRYAWEESGLPECCDHLNEAVRNFTAEQCGDPRDIRDAQSYTKALNFGKDEVYRRRRA